MVELGGAPDIGAVAALVLTSFCSFVIGVVFRKWPCKVQSFVEPLDGSSWLMRPETHRALIERSGAVLIVLSFAALLAVGYVLR